MLSRLVRRPRHRFTVRPRRRTTLVLIPLLVLTGLLGTAVPAVAGTAEDPLTVLSDWTQPEIDSYRAWNAARLNPDAWAGYAFDWSTDYCSASPDIPLGFDFRLACHRHDFGYRNYKAYGLFSANKSRLDDAFYADLRRVCAHYSPVVRPTCRSLAWTYYRAVCVFGSVLVGQADLDRATRMQATALDATA